MLNRTSSWHFPLCGAGFLLAGFGCAFVFVQALWPDLLGPTANLATALAVALGLAVLYTAYRHHVAERNRAALAEPVDRLTALNEQISNQAREMATQTLDLIQQRDGFKSLVRELAEKQHWLEAAPRQLPSGALLLDQNLNVNTRNERFRELLGIPATKVTKSLHDFRGWPAETIDGAPIPFENWPLVRAIRDGVIIHDQQMRIGTGAGGWIDAVVSAAPIRGPQGEPRGGVLLVNELTACRENDERLHLLESAVIHANDAIIVLEAVSAEGRGRLGQIRQRRLHPPYRL